METYWEELKKHLIDKCQFTDRILDYISVVDILELSVSGFSNKSICNRLDFDEDYVYEVLAKYLHFAGFTDDLGFNPYFIYGRSISLEDFEYEVKLVVHPIDISLEVCYNICYTYDLIRKELDKFYESN